MLLHEDYFSVIDTEAKAYLIGFLLADGCITRASTGEYKQVQLHISTVDYDIVNTLQRETGNTAKVYVSPENTRCMFRASSIKMTKDLAKFGIVPRKTGEETPNFSSIPTQLLRHTMRGLVDGDGWISIGESSTGKLTTSVGVCGSYMECLEFTEYVHNSLGLNLLHPSKVKGKNCFKLGYSSLRDGKIIVNNLYSDCRVVLKRKLAKAQELMRL